MANQLLTQLESFQSESESSTILYVCVCAFVLNAIIKLLKGSAPFISIESSHKLDK